MNTTTFKTEINKLPSVSNIDVSKLGGSSSTNYYPLLDGIEHYLRTNTSYTQDPNKITLSGLQTKGDYHEIKIEGQKGDALGGQMAQAYDEYGAYYNVKTKILQMQFKSTASPSGKTTDDRTTKLKRDLIQKATFGGTVFQPMKQLTSVAENKQNEKNKMLIEEINRIKKILDNGKI